MFGLWHRKNKTSPVRRTLRRFLADRVGGPMVEFLIVLPIFLTLVFGAIESAMVFLTYSTMLDAARDATRGLALGTLDTTTAVTLAQERLLLDANVFTITPASPAATSADDVSVTITVPVASVTTTGFFPLSDTELRVRIVMRKEPIA